MTQLSQDFPHLRRATARQLELLEELRAGHQIALRADADYAEALRLWGIEREIVQAWAAAVRRGSRRQICPEVGTWAPVVRRRFAIEDAVRRCLP
jgi:hypothetical protein